MIFDRLVQLFIFFGVCGYVPFMSQMGFQSVILDFGGPSLFALHFYSQNRICRNLGIGVLLLACIWTSLFLSVIKYPVGIIHVISGCMAYYAIVCGVNDVKSIAKVLVLAGCINIVIAFCQRFGFDPIYVVSSQNPSVQEQHFSMAGIMGRNYHLGYLLAVTSPLAIYLNFRIGIIYTIISGIIIYWVGSLSVGIAFIVTLLFFLSRWVNKTILFAVCGLMIIPFILHFQEILSKFSLRKDALEFCIRSYLENPFIGHGLGSFTGGTYTLNPFSQLTTSLFEIGLIPSVVIIFSSIKYFKSIGIPLRTLWASVSALMTYPLFHDTFIFARLSILTISVLALCEIEGLNRRGYGQVGN